MNKMLLITALLICAQNVDAASNQRSRRALQNLEAETKAALRRQLTQQAIDQLLALRRRAHPLAPALAQEFADEDAPSAPASPVAARRPLMGIDELTPSRLVLNNDGSSKTVKQMRIALERLSPEELLGTAGLDYSDDETPSLLG